MGVKGKVVKKKGSVVDNVAEKWPVFPHPKLTEIEAALGVTTRTLKNWKDRGLPLDDFEKFSAFVVTTSRGKDVLMRLAAWEASLVDGRDAGAGDVGELVFDFKTGSSEALKRLETLEKFLAMKLVGSMKLGAIDQKLAMDGYLPVVELLRKMDLAIEKDRRDAGELIPRRDMELIARRTGMAVGFSEEKFLDGLPSRESRQLRKQSLYDAVTGSINQAAVDGKFPDWWVEAFGKGLGE